MKIQLGKRWKALWASEVPAPIDAPAEAPLRVDLSTASEADEPVDASWRVAGEIETYRNVTDIHALPDIFHVWSQKYLAADLIEVFGSADLIGILATELRLSVQRTGNPRIVSVGAGDGSIEIAIARKLLAEGFDNFRIECLELSPFLIGRGRERLAAERLEPHVQFQEVDLSQWVTAERYGAAFAHHSLHHIVALEHVFDQLKASLEAEASFVTSDMIGRNGHMRWPEVEQPIRALWSRMPERYKYNHQLSRDEPEFVNWDCSTEGYEGVRAQDIMPELVKRFSFEKLCAWGGLTDIFIDRSFGHNFDPANPEDVSFIYGLADADRAMNRIGAIIPTNLIAVMRSGPTELRATNDLTPEKCIRRSSK